MNHHCQPHPAVHVTPPPLARRPAQARGTRTPHHAVLSSPDPPNSRHPPRDSVPTPPTRPPLPLSSTKRHTAVPATLLTTTYGTLVSLALAVVLLVIAAAPAAARPAWRWPLDGRPQILRPFTPPPEPWLSGHRGLDLAAAPATPVLSAGPGVVRYAGPVGGRGVVTVDHAGGLRTTYLPVKPSVRRGQPITLGGVLGVVENMPGHCRESCLHWGLLRGPRYLDPLLLLGQAHIRLLPYWGITSAPPRPAQPSPSSMWPLTTQPSGPSSPKPPSTSASQLTSPARNPVRATFSGTPPTEPSLEFLMRSASTSLVPAASVATLLGVLFLIALLSRRRTPTRRHTRARRRTPTVPAPRTSPDAEARTNPKPSPANSAASEPHRDTQPGRDTGTAWNTETGRRPKPAANKRLSSPPAADANLQAPQITRPDKAPETCSTPLADVTVTPTHRHRHQPDQLNRATDGTSPQDDSPRSRTNARGRHRRERR
ncbi:M23 family metallopeptidase [Nonomuraea sp. NPDC005983]|uniref:M23 family metallopeptidase n=1 Tax=Nonomuraea sp. NPDC005983 TaxID=3155595 RepID=UPI00339F855A